MTTTETARDFATLHQLIITGKLTGQTALSAIDDADLPAREARILEGLVIDVVESWAR